MLFQKSIVTQFSMSYPAMSVYEFEYLKEEAEVLEYWRNSSIYLICQRPVLFFDEITFDSGEILMKIKQRGQSEELNVSLTIYENDKKLGGSGGFWLDLNFYDKKPGTTEPYKNVGGIKLLNSEQEFVVWYTPERLIYEYIKGRLPNLEITGDIHDFLTYSIHYIGQSQSQGIWERLTGHEKLSSVLIKELPFIEGEFSPFELSLIFLGLEDATEFPSLTPNENEDEVVDFEGNIVSDEEIGSSFFHREMDDVKFKIVNDYEAFLINFFEPKYNKIKFKNYPHIANGLKSIGYTEIVHETMVLATLNTEEASIQVKITPIYGKLKDY